MRLFSAMALFGIFAGAALAYFSQSETMTLSADHTGTPTLVPLEIGDTLDLGAEWHKTETHQTINPKTILLDPGCQSCTTKKIDWSRVIATSPKPIIFYSDRPASEQFKLNNVPDVLVVSVSEAAPQIQTLLPFAPVRIQLDHRQTVIAFEILTAETTP